MASLVVAVLLTVTPASAASAIASTPEAALTAPIRCTPISRGEVESLFERWNAALASGDPTRVAALYSDDALLLPTLSNRARETPEAIRDYFEGFLARKPRGRIDHRQIRLGCNAALDAGTYSFELSSPDGAPPAWVQARYTFAYVYGPDGWRIQHHHSSLMPAN